MMTKDGQKFHPFDEAYFRCSHVMQMLDREKEEEYLLINEIIANSAMFIHKAIRYNIIHNKPKRLAELIIKIKPVESMNTDQLTGICFALIGLNQETLERFPAFLKLLPHDQALTVVDKLREPAKNVLKAKEVREYLFQNWYHITESELRTVYDLRR